MDALDWAFLIVILALYVGSCVLILMSRRVLFRWLDRVFGARRHE